jgi:hypothetical protein
MALEVGAQAVVPFLVLGGFYLNNRYRMALPVPSCDTIRTVTLSKIRCVGDGSGPIPSTLEISHALHCQGRIRGAYKHPSHLYGTCR